jgi:hypothetical protein
MKIIMENKIRVNHIQKYDLESEQLGELRERLFQVLNSSNGKERTKESIRELHIPQREERSHAEFSLLSKYGTNYMVPH